MDRKGLSSKDVAKALRLSDVRVVRHWTRTDHPRDMPDLSMSPPAPHLGP